MKTYAINLVTDTKHTDIYDKVALNKFPIIVRCKTESELRDLISNEDTTNYVKNTIKNKRVFDAAYWMIRSVYQNGDVRELSWKVSDLISIDYSQNNTAIFEDNSEGE